MPHRSRVPGVAPVSYFCSVVDVLSHTTDARHTPRTHKSLTHGCNMQAHVSEVANEVATSVLRVSDTAIAEALN